jgi:hypothetical protein
MSDIYKINDVNYFCEFKLKNSDDQEVKFTKSSVRGLTIVDNFFNPFFGGTIGIANPYDLIEDTYLLRGDGRDVLDIKIHPEDYPEDIIEKSFILIDDTNFGNPQVRSENIKKFDLIQKEALPFMEKIPYNRTYSGKIGDIIKDIFIELLGEEIVDEDNWESGDFVITYRPPLTFRYMDLLFYLLRHFYAKDDEIHTKGFISQDHKNKKFQLKLLSKIFKENSDNIMEVFSFSDLTNSSNTFNPNNPPPDDTDISFFNNGLKNFAYSTPLYSWNNDYFLNNIVHAYDPILGKHDMAILRLSDLKEKWSKNFVDVFSSVGGKTNPFLVTNKISNTKYKHYRSPYDINNTVKMVEAESYNILTFYNLQCMFSNLGGSYRNAGKFLDLVKTGDTIQKNDEKILGRWFVTEIRHLFLGDGYTNEFSCCKTYVGPQSRIKDDAE